MSVNTPEMRGETRPAGEAARLYTESWLMARVSSEWSLRIQTYKADAFGRYLADVWDIATGAHLNSDLVTSGHAKVDIR